MGKNILQKNLVYRQREEARDLGAEPGYPGVETVVFSVRWPEWTVHGRTGRCDKESPHRIEECGEFVE